MNKKPVCYMQTDPKWANTPYAVQDETSTIGLAGCGPTCAAMCLAELVDPNITPITTCNWAVSNGYKAYKQGTYYAYLTAQFKPYKIDCIRLNYESIYHKPLQYAEVHDKAKKYVQDGWYLIALMKAGIWTKSGHFILVWDWDDNGVISINDPNSKAPARIKTNSARFTKEVAYYWAVDARSYNRGGGKVMAKEPHTWSEEARNWAVKQGLIKGDETGDCGWLNQLTKEDLITILYRYDQQK